MIDVSATGSHLILKGPNLTTDITEFSDDGTPFEFGDHDIADAGMNLNGMMVTWTKAVCIEFSVTVLPNSDSDYKLNNYLRLNSIGGRGEIGEAYIESATLMVPLLTQNSTVKKAFRSYRLTSGRMRRGPVAASTNAEGKLQPRTYSFVFEKFDA